MTFRVIGLSGRAGSGKTTVARRLSHEHGFAQLAFADPLKAAARAIFGFTDAQLYGDLKEVVDPLWEKSPRKIMQLLGTDCIRKVIDDDAWIKAAKRAVERIRGGDTCPGVAIHDVRFPNEAEAIKQMGGQVWRIERPGIAAVEPHISEIALDEYKGFHCVLNNQGDTLESLHKLVDEALRRIT